MVNLDDLTALEVRSNLYDCAFSRETFHKVADKEALMTAMQEGLKDNCPLLLTDFFVAPGAEADARTESWVRGEVDAVHPWSADEAAELLRQLNFELRVDEDMTATYRANVFAGWEAFIDAHARGGIPRRLLAPLMEAAELWSRRIDAIDHGVLSVYRLVGLKK